MKQNNLIDFEAVKKILEENRFFGFTAKRNDGRIEYSFINISYFTITFKILTTKLDPNNVKSKKIVLGVKMNEKELNGWNDFVTTLKNIYHIHKKRAIEKYISVDFKSSI